MQSYSNVLKMLSGVTKSQLIIEGISGLDCWRVSQRTALQARAKELLEGICTQ